MSDIPPVPPKAFSPAPILPVPADVLRPYWSVMIPTYNREQYLEETVRSVLDQDPGRDRMQLAVVDNATTTHDVRAMLKRLAGDRIDYFRHDQNIGGIGNINSCFGFATGQHVHVLHDDDKVLRGFYAEMEQAIGSHPTATLFTGPVLGINEHGYVTGLNAPPGDRAGVIADYLPSQAVANRTPTQAVVIARDLLTRIGGYVPGLVFTPDWEFAFRAGAAGAAVTIALPLAAYRWHGGSDTSRLIRGTRHLEETRAVIDELCGRLSEPDRAKVAPWKYAFLASAAAHYAATLTAPADRKARLENLKWAYQYDPTRARLKTLVKARIRGTLMSVLGK
jgi:GT2 family glycosyltransferase